MPFRVDCARRFQKNTIKSTPRGSSVDSSVPAVATGLLPEDGNHPLQCQALTDKSYRIKPRAQRPGQENRYVVHMPVGDFHTVNHSSPQIDQHDISMIGVVQNKRMQIRYVSHAALTGNGAGGFCAVVTDREISGFRVRQKSPDVFLFNCRPLRPFGFQFVIAGSGQIVAVVTAVRCAQIDPAGYDLSLGIAEQDIMMARIDIFDHPASGGTE